jgi:hypothetical protein
MELHVAVYLKVVHSGNFYIEVKVKVEVKQVHYRPGVAQRIPGRSGSHIS